jgi:hypothetical protein
MRATTVFLIAAALIAATVSYGGREAYTLTIASTPGGLVITPAEGTFNYLKGDMVRLVAGIQAGYRLVDWTGNMGTIANINDVITTIAMNDHYYNYCQP